MAEQSASSPASSGPAGPLFEGQVGAYYLLSLLSDAPPRGLPGTTIERVELQRASEGHPLDDVIVHARDSHAHPAVLAIQVKRTVTFAPSDPVFRAVVAQIAATTQRPDFWESRYELAIAIARTTQKTEVSYQEVLAWARTLDSADTFLRRIERPGSGNDDMRAFVRTFRDHLSSAGVASDDLTVWNLLGRLQILTFDFTATGSATEELAKERSADALHADDRSRAASLWGNLVEIALRIAATGGDRTRVRLIEDLRERSFRLAGTRNFASARAHLREAAFHALGDIGDRVGNVTLMRPERLTSVRDALARGRYVEIRGEAGVGKSAVLKQVANQLAQESQIIVLSPNRTTPNGWSAMRATLGFDGTAHQLLVDMAASGGAVLFVDSLENFSEAEQRTVIDLVREAAGVLGFSIVATARPGFAKEEPSWLPADALTQLGRSVPVVIGELTESEIAELRDAAPALATLLASNHPARDVIRNLYRLARLSSLPASEPLPRTEIDMARQWWESADGRRDAGHRDRARLLHALAKQTLDRKQPLDATGHPSSAIDALTRSETLRDLGTDRVVFRHDVLREWATANLLHSEPGSVDRLPLTQVAPVWLARAVELTARIALERSTDDASWNSLLERVSPADSHGSWRRAVLLSCVRSEAAPIVLVPLTSRLLADKAKLLRELIRTVMAVDVIPLAESLLAAGVDKSAIAADLKTPSGPSWVRLIMWTLSLGDQLPPAAVPEVAELYSGWCWGTLGRDPLTPVLLSVIYRWLMEIETARQPRSRLMRSDFFGGEVQEHQVRALEASLRGTFVLFSNRVPDLAAEYLRSLAQREPHDAAVGSVLKFRGTLARAAPTELAQLTAAALIPRETKRARRRRYDLSRPFGFADHQFLPASPAQGPFHELLVNAAPSGFALIRQLVDHAIEFYSDNRSYGSDVIRIVFPDGERGFPWIRSYNWSRDEGGHGCVTSGLMALEAWAHSKIESGTPVEAVLADVLESGEAAAAYLLVAVDLILSHWPTTSQVAIPFLASPELLCLDRQRAVLDGMEQPDIFGFKALKKEPRGAVTLDTLKKRPSRQRLLDTLLGQYAVGEATEGRERLRTLLEQARDRLGPPMKTSNLGDPEFMVLHALNLIEPSNWREVSVRLRNGESATAFEYVPPAAETEHLRPQQEAAAGRERDASFEAALSLALDSPERSSADLAAQGVAWAQSLPPQTNEDDEHKDAPWMREQAVFAAALILARDGGAELRAQHGDWARQVFARALLTEEDPGRSVRSGLRFNPIAMAFVGLTYLLRDRAEPVDLRAILEVAAREEPAGAHGFARVTSVLAAIDERLPRAVLRCALTATIRSRGLWDSRTEDERALAEHYQEKLRSAVDSELAWLSSSAAEPSWPTFPSERPRVRRGLRIPEFESTEEVPEPREPVNEYVNYRAGAIWLRAATRQRPASSEWICDLICAYSSWTFEANGSGLPRKEDVEPAPDEWNQVYFELLGSYLNSCSLAQSSIDSLRRLPDEPFFDILPTFLRALDELYFNAQAVDTAQIVSVRAKLAERLMASYRWTRLRGTPSDSIEMHIGPAIAVLLFNYFYPFAAPPQCYLNPPAIERLDAFVSTLGQIASGSPCLFVALVTLNLLEVSPRPSHLPLLLVAAEAWLEVYPENTVFWSDRDVGKRVCAVIDRGVGTNVSGLEPASRARLDRLLAAFVRLGVAEASALERKLAGSP
jgi:hypothetical protein